MDSRLSLDGVVRTGRAVVAHVGRVSVFQGRKLLQTAGLLTAILLAGIHPRNWPRTIRNALARQVITSGVEAIGVICFLALSLGVLLVVQYDAWIGKVVQSRLLGPVVVVVVVRELGPLLVNFIVIARSGNAVTTELGLMHVTGEIRVLEGLGVDPLLFVVVPRVFGLIISVCCLTLIFMVVALMGVYFCGQWIGAKTGTLGEFVESVLGLLTVADVVNVLLKSTLPPLLAGVICCGEGLRAGDTPSDVPRASRTAVQRSVVLLFIVSALVSVVTYL
jgi:phospholipid/cholesterol/gamma-HCH transport system permease protein